MAESIVNLLPLGATVQSLHVEGQNIVLGFDKQEDYVEHNEPYFGVSVGRVANRIKDAKLDSINGGQTYTLAANNGKNNLHGGVVGWAHRIWDGPKPIGTKTIDGVDGLEGGESVEFTLKSEDGDEGFPGTVLARTIYTTGTQNVDGKKVTVLGIEYEAELTEKAFETPLNMTNHSYFNLTGGPSIEGTVVTLASDTYLPVDDGGIPTAGPAPFSGLAANEPFTLGAEEPDIDDCFVINANPGSVPIDTRGEPLRLNAAAHHPSSGLHLEVLSTEPAFQFYTGKYIGVPAVGTQPARGKRSGFCVEPSRYVNAVNVDEWKGMTLLRRGQTYGCRIVYRVWKE